MELDCNLDPFTSHRNVFLGYIIFPQFLKCVLPPFHVSFHGQYLLSLTKLKTFFKINIYKNFHYKNLNPRFVLSREVVSLCWACTFAFVRSCFVLKTVFPFWTYSISPLEVRYLSPEFLFTSC